MKLKTKLHLMLYSAMKQYYYMRPTLRTNPIRFGKGGTHEPYELAHEGLAPDSIVYTFGVGDDMHLELELMKEYGMHVLCYDPTPIVAEYVRETLNKYHAFDSMFHFYPYALTNQDGICKFYFPEDKGYSGSLGQDKVNWHKISNEYMDVKGFCLNSLMKMNGYDHIDYLKLCVEGIECDVVQNIVENHIDVRQISIALCGSGTNEGYENCKKIYWFLRNNGYGLLPYEYPGHVTFVKKISGNSKK